MQYWWIVTYAKQMSASASPSSPGRQERRKAATRAKILEAAEQLFGERGYAHTSIEEISELADVAVRTIYIHFPTKASMMLAYFDSWMDAFSQEIRNRPVDEPVVETVSASLEAMKVAGWVDKIENDSIQVHPIAEHLESGTPDIAGHILQRWMSEMRVLTADAQERGSFEPGSLVPQSRAIAVFSSWISAMFVAKGGGSVVSPDSEDGPGLQILSLVTSGNL